MSAVFKRGRAEMEANLTPMIDVTFLLIVFFVLVSRIVDVETVKMQVPELEDPLTTEATDENRVIINVAPDPADPSSTAGYQVAGRVFPANDAGVSALADYLAARYRSNPALNVNLRADESVHYEWVEPAMRAVTLAAVESGVADLTPRVNLVVVEEET